MEWITRIRKSKKPMLLGRMLNNFSISQKMLLIFIGCVILPVLIQNIYYYNTTEKNIQHEVLQRLNQTLSEKTSKVNGCISGTMALALRYYKAEDLYQFLDKNYQNKLDYFIQYQNHLDDLWAILAYNQQVGNLILYTDNPTIFSGAYVKRLTSSQFSSLGEKPLDSIQEPLSASSDGPSLRIALAPQPIRTTTDRSLGILQPLTYYPEHSNHKKSIRLDINLAYIVSMLTERDLFDNIALVDSEGRIVASANTYSETGPYDHFSAKTLKKGTVVLKQQLADVPLSLYGFYDSSMISREFADMRSKTIVIATICMLLAVMFILLVATNITKRTKLLVSLSQNIAQGNFTQISPEKIGNDEIGKLAESINQMSEQLQTLIDEEYKARLTQAHLERETTQAKLLALQSQVNPHFMFNTLECVRLKASVKNEQETAKIILYVSKMFRHLINWDEDIIELKADIRFLEEFLYVQKYRFEDEFEYQVVVDEEANQCLLPKLIIQPLVENACVHGVESISGNRRIAIRIAVSEGKMIISVMDNGSGMDERRLLQLRTMLSGGEKVSGSVGLYNVYQRLKLYYGDQFSMDLVSRLDQEQGQGTQITITVPVRFTRGEF